MKIIREEIEKIIKEWGSCKLVGESGKGEYLENDGVEMQKDLVSLFKKCALEMVGKDDHVCGTDKGVYVNQPVGYDAMDKIRNQLREEIRFRIKQ